MSVRGKSKINYETGKLQAKLFTYGHYSPLPFLAVMFLYRYPNIWSLIIGFAIACCGEAIRLWAMGYAGDKTKAAVATGSGCLIITGPFAHMRHPLYTGNILLYTGLALMSFAVFPLLQLVIFCFFFFQYRYLAAKQEENLRKAFGKEFDDYRNSVPRFFPKLSAYRKEGTAQPEASFNQALRNELRTLQAFGLISVTIVLIWFIGRY